MTTITTADLALEVGLTPKAIRGAVQRGELRVTRHARGREQAVFTIDRADADEWKAQRAAKRKPCQEKEAAPQRPRHQGAFFPNQDAFDLRSHSPIWQRDALAGDEGAKEMLRQIGMTVWWNREAGSIL